MQGTYLRFDSAGDAYVGRTVCGLDVNSDRFAVLPPRFKHEFVNAEVREAVQACFPQLHDAEMGLYLLASLVHHAPWLRKTLPETHSIFNSVFFSQEMDLRFKDNVVLDFAWETDELAAQGIPPHVRQLAMQKEMIESLQTLLREQRALPEMLRTHVNDAANSW